MIQKLPKPRYNSLAAALLLTALYIFQPNVTKAQVGIGTETPHSSAIFDLVSTDKGMLISRVELRDLRDSPPLPNPLTACWYGTPTGTLDLAFTSGVWPTMLGIPCFHARSTIRKPLPVSQQETSPTGTPPTHIQLPPAMSTAPPP